MRPTQTSISKIFLHNMEQSHGHIISYLLYDCICLVSMPKLLLEILHLCASYKICESFFRTQIPSSMIPFYLFETILTRALEEANFPLICVIHLYHLSLCKKQDYIDVISNKLPLIFHVKKLPSKSMNVWQCMKAENKLRLFANLIFVTCHWGRIISPNQFQLTWNVLLIINMPCSLKQGT